MNRNDPFLQKIRDLIEEKVSRRIATIADARKLAEHMGAVRLSVSSYTLARLWGIVSPFRNPYPATLDTLARFAGYRDWADFCDRQPLLHNDPNFFLTEDPGGFSLSLLEIALSNRDAALAGRVLAKFDAFDNERLCFDIAMVLGHFIRRMDNKNELLLILAGSATGRRLFYEIFVDEDDPGGYFSNALTEFYLPRVRKPGRRIFACSFLISHEAYRENRVSRHFSDFFRTMEHCDISDLHFHELSRIHESLMIWDGLAGKLHKTWESHLTRVLRQCDLTTLRGESWLLYRYLRPISFFGLAGKLRDHPSFSHKVEELVRKSSWKTGEISDYLLQFWFLLHSKNSLRSSPYVPFRIGFLTYPNEQNERTALDAAVSWIFAMKENKGVLESELRRHCLETKTLWVEKMVFNP